MDVGFGLHPRKTSVYDMQCITAHQIIRSGQVNLVTHWIVNGNKQKNQATIFLSLEYIQNIEVTFTLRQIKIRRYDRKHFGDFERSYLRRKVFLLLVYWVALLKG